MFKILQNIARKATVLIAVFAIILLNFSSVVQCGSLLLNEDCCHVTNLVKPCCVKNLKITAEPRITGHCGCTMKDAHQPGDFYIDITPNLIRNYQVGSIDFEQSILNFHSVYLDFQSANYLPPETSFLGLYLTNMNLRI